MVHSVSILDHFRDHLDDLTSISVLFAELMCQDRAIAPPDRLNVPRNRPMLRRFRSFQRRNRDKQSRFRGNGAHEVSSADPVEVEMSIFLSKTRHFPSKLARFRQ
jgi:hypothetical protein